MKVVSLFTGAGGLDLGFKKAGFETVWANEFDKNMWSSFRHNFPDTELCERSITVVDPATIPDSDGIIGGPPCQSWSEGGSLRGIEDPRGQLFYDYVRVLKEKQPKFFLAENVSGILFERHRPALLGILQQFEEVGYTISLPRVINANDYGVPQDRERVFIVGYHKDKMGGCFRIPEPTDNHPTLKDAIQDLPDPLPGVDETYANPAESLTLPNHEYMVGGWSSIFMSRQRVRSWGSPSYTIQATARHAPLHPQASPMIWKGKNEFIFDPNSQKPYRRMSIRECLRVQTFPDDFTLLYRNLTHGYKMVGNAVPVELAKHMALQIAKDMTNPRLREETALEATWHALR